MRRILNQCQQAVKSKIWLAVDAGKQCQIVTAPAVVAKLQRVRSPNCRQDVTPVIVVLDEIALRETNAEANTLPRNSDARN